MKPNPFNLSAAQALANPNSIPDIMARGMASIMYEFKTGKRDGRKSTMKDPGSDMERFTAAFNIISSTFTRANIIKGRQKSLKLTGNGLRRETVMDRTSDNKEKEKKAKIAKLKTIQERNTARAAMKPTIREKMRYFEQVLERLKRQI